MIRPLALITDTMARQTARRADARVAGLVGRMAAQGAFDGLELTPAVRNFGDFVAARAALRGRLHLGGFSRPLPDLTPWDAPLPTQALTDRLHGFAWLDDFEALSGKAARGLAQGWTLGWLDRYGRGTVTGWSVVPTAARLTRLLTHLPFLDPGLAPEHATALRDTLPVHTRFLAETWAEVSTGVDRFAALSGLIHGTVCLTGFEAQRTTAVSSLTRLCSERVGTDGGLRARNPEAALEVFCHLLDIRAVLTQAGHEPPEALNATVERMAPALRTLRHGDGSLARFHGGGGGGTSGKLDRALAESRVRTRPSEAPALGFARLQAGRVTLIADCARPPDRSEQAHASTLAFEMSSGRRPVIVSMGPAIDHLPQWARVPRTTAAHSTLSLDKTSSSKLPAAHSGRGVALSGTGVLQTRPSMVTLARADDATGEWIQARHDGYLADYGLVHERRLFLGARGHQIFGEDMLLAPDAKAERRFQARIKGATKLGVALAVHFHLHPDVEAEHLTGRDIIRLTLKSGEIWLFGHNGGQVNLEGGTYLDPAQPEPVPTRQIVLSHRVTNAAAELGWSLMREAVTGPSPRDTIQDTVRNRRADLTAAFAVDDPVR